MPATMPDEGFTQLVADRVILRRFGPADVTTFVSYRSDPAIARYQSWDAPYPRASGERDIAALLGAHPDTPGEWFQFAMALRETGELIGDCASFTDAADPRLAEIGFTLSPRFQGRGYATEGARALLGYLFAARSKHRVMARCDPRNTASATVLERLGMRREGHLRESTWAKGEWTDDLVYAVLDHEWPTPAQRPR
jgi:RimJ/RimL family protein N-acetyltransferase